MTEPTVVVVDDDQAALHSLAFLIESMNIKVQTFDRPKEFLQNFDPSVPGCLVLDVRMPEMNGLDLQAELEKWDYIPPIIFVSGHGDIPMSVRAIKAGAIDFLQKPIKDQILLDRINEAIQIDKHARESMPPCKEFSDRVSRLTSREREVMELLVQGRSLKQISIEFGISFQTVSKHRARVLDKLEVGNDVELVRLCLGHEQSTD
ncbi:Response regulator protein TmoT [Stieleria neptunia]|uniref:Response regulator protein TmoT n=1 Tax=Stieleria neptunia TaxID=2527979 RepID=A0A518HW83_9BACT|nr:response regulator [Stieleria neptunia]QDV45034.1 Response regulator protein TmoT [Stieleria neptunia]